MARATRAKDQKKLVLVYIDEADIVIDATIAAILDRCRSQNIALILAIQRTGQIEDPRVLDALESCAIRMAHTDAEAPYFSKLLRVPEDKMYGLPKGHFATHIRRQEPHIAKFKETKLPFRDMTEAEERAHRQRMIDLYGYTREAAPTEAVEAGNRYPAVERHAGPPTVERTYEAPQSAASVTEPPRDRVQASDASIALERDPSKPAKWG